ncbi:MAG: DUF1707 domain-containing protein [bacterium]
MDGPRDTAGQGPVGPSGPSPGPPSYRIGYAEREQVITALDAHLEAGRLNAGEYGERVGRAAVARTVEDITPLFTDLPAPHPAFLSGGPVLPASTPTRRHETAAYGWSSGAAGPGSPAGAGTSRMPPPGAPPLPIGPDPALVDRHGRAGRGVPLGGRVGEVAVAVSPFVALILFFALNGVWDSSWLLFLLIPVTGVVVYGRHRR